MAFVALTACDKSKTPDVFVSDDQTVNYEAKVVLPQAVGSGPNTRTAIGPAAQDGVVGDFSMAAIPDNPANEPWYHEYIGYDNLRVSPTWNGHSFVRASFAPRGQITAMSPIGFFPTKGSLSIYGVYPYMSDFHQRLDDLEHIPFSVGNTTANNYDYLYLEPTHIDMTGVVPGDTRTMTLSLKHVMTTVEIRLRATLYGTVAIDSIALHAFDGTARTKIFTMKGDFSATTGEITRRDPASFIDHFSMGYNAAAIAIPQSSVSYTPFAFIFPSVEHLAGRKIVATIYFRNVNQSKLDLVVMDGQMEFPFDNILTDLGDGDGPERNGLVAGYRYVYEAAIDNFIKYSGYPEVEEWVLPTGEPDDDQIKEIVI